MVFLDALKDLIIAIAGFGLLTTGIILVSRPNDKARALILYTTLVLSSIPLSLLGVFAGDGFYSGVKYLLLPPMAGLALTLIVFFGPANSNRWTSTPFLFGCALLALLPFSALPEVRVYVFLAWFVLSLFGWVSHLTHRQQP